MAVQLVYDGPPLPDRFKNYPELSSLKTFNLLLLFCEREAFHFRFDQPTARRWAENFSGEKNWAQRRAKTSCFFLGELH